LDDDLLAHELGGLRGAMMEDIPVGTTAHVGDPKDLEIFQKSIADAATTSTNLWISNLFVIFYIGLASGAVTHADLFVANPVRLPFLSIELSLPAFFVLSPIIFLISHSYTLIHFVLLAGKIRLFEYELNRQLPDDHEQRSDMRRLLPSNIFVQMLAGPKEVRSGLFGALLRLIATTTLVISPVLLLILLQVKFLPYHSILIVWIQRFCLLADILLIWLLLPAALQVKNEPRRRRLTRSKVALCAGAATVIFSWGYASFPGEFQQRMWDYIDLPDGKFNHIIAKSLRLDGFNIYASLGSGDRRDEEGRNFSLDLDGRNLSAANFNNANLERVRFDGANLAGASFIGAGLAGASLSNLELLHTNYTLAFMPGANFDKSDLQGADFTGAKMPGATFVGAGLQGASLLYARLEGASFQGADLTGAKLDGAVLKGVFLGQAKLIGTSFNSAYLQGADFSGQPPTKEQIAIDVEGKFAEWSPPDITAADFFHAYIWKMRMPIFAEYSDWAKEARFSNVVWDRSYDDQLTRQVRQWSETDYVNLKELLERDIPAGKRKFDALNRIAALRCESPLSPSTDCSANTNSQFELWQHEIAQEPLSNYGHILAHALSSYFCEQEPNETTVAALIGVLKPAMGISRFDSAGKAEAVAVYNRILGPDCNLATSLTKRARDLLMKRRHEWSGIDAGSSSMPRP
jgi:uncharacterized protein YjbI with pentapeptide repeats